MEKLFINAFGDDKPGIVSTISGLVTSMDGNIEESKMVKINSMFSVIMIISIPIKSKKIFIQKLKNINDLKLFVEKLKEKKHATKYKQYIFSLECIDNEGIIHHFTNYFKKENINVDKMETTTNNAPITGSILFKLESIISIPQNYFGETFCISWGPRGGLQPSRPASLPLGFLAAEA